jgi:hypothetical protein
VLGHAPGAREGLPQQHLDVSVDAAKLIARPSGECVMHLGIDAQEDLFSVLAHV